MQKVYIVGAKRTPIGSFLGSLKDASVAHLGSTAVKGVLEESGVAVEDINEVMIGNVLPAGQGQGVARQVSIHSGIPVTVPAYGVNMVCGSGMKTVMNAYMSILANENQVVVAGGVESMSQTPYMVPGKSRSGLRLGNVELEDHMVKDGLTDVFHGYHMGITAENIVKQYGIGREKQDEFAYQSQQKAIQAIDAGEFQTELTPVELVTRTGTTFIETDEYPNRYTNLKKLASLRPAFTKNGTVTAGNASGINDGASATLLVGESYLHEKNLKPLAEIISIGQGGVDPSVMGLGPTPAIKKALKSAGLTLEQIDILELNEAFAAQSLGVLHELTKEFDVDKNKLMSRTNLNGGAIALGHPIGASGNRILVTLIHLLKKKNLEYGLASLCIGGGMGTAIIIRNSNYDPGK